MAPERDLKWRISDPENEAGFDCKNHNYKDLTFYQRASLPPPFACGYF
jgi:hypothetical protein